MADHPDDLTDDIDALRDNLRFVRERLAQRADEMDKANALIAEMRQQLQDEAELRQRWIDVFDMQMGEDGTWLFDRKQTELWEQYVELHEAHAALIRKWNQFVGEYNVVVAPRPVKPKGRPLAASPSQVERVRSLRGQGKSYGQIAKTTGLSLTTIRSIVTAPQKQAQERERLVRLELNRLAAKRFRERQKRRQGLERAINEISKKSAKLVKAAKGA